MKKTAHISSIIVTAIVAVLFAAPAPAQAAAPRPEEKILELINQERKKAGVDDLVRDGDLDKIAQGWASTIASTRTPSADGSLLEKVEAAKNNGMTSLTQHVRAVCEPGPQAIEAAFTRWNASPDTRGAMVSKNYQAHGFGYDVSADGCFWLVSIYYGGTGIVAPVDSDRTDIFSADKGGADKGDVNTTPGTDDQGEPDILLVTGTLYSGTTHKKPAGSRLRIDISSSHDGMIQRRVNGRWVDHHALTQPHTTKSMPLSTRAGTTTYRIRFFFGGDWESLEPFTIITTKKVAVAKASVRGFRSGTVSTRTKVYSDKVTLSHKGYLQKYTGKKWVTVRSLKKGVSTVKIKPTSRRTSYRVVIKKSSKNTSVVTKRLHLKRR